MSGRLIPEREGSKHATIDTVDCCIYCYTGHSYMVIDYSRSPRFVPKKKISSQDSSIRA